jgi:hypothetical protein
VLEPRLLIGLHSKFGSAVRLKAFANSSPGQRRQRPRVSTTIPIANPESVRTRFEPFQAQPVSGHSVTQGGPGLELANAFGVLLKSTP